MEDMGKTIGRGDYGAPSWKKWVDANTKYNSIAKEEFPSFIDIDDLVGEYDEVIDRAKQGSPRARDAWRQKKSLQKISANIVARLMEYNNSPELQAKRRQLHEEYADEWEKADQPADISAPLFPEELKMLDDLHKLTHPDENNSTTTEDDS